MSYELISIAIMMIIIMIGGRQLRTAKKLLNDTQSVVSSEIFSASRKGIPQICLVLILLLIVGLFFASNWGHIFSFAFFFISFVLQIFYLLRLKLFLSLSDLPREYTALVLKINVWFLAGLFIVVLAFIVTII